MEPSWPSWPSSVPPPPVFRWAPEPEPEKEVSQVGWNTNHSTTPALGTAQKATTPTTSQWWSNQSHVVYDDPMDLD